jgi:hypothetical protein
MSGAGPSQQGAATPVSPEVLAAITQAVQAAVQAMHGMPTPAPSTSGNGNGQFIVGILRPADVGYFHPNYVSKEPLEHIVYDKQDMIFRDVNLFIDRLRDVANDNPTR